MFITYPILIFVVMAMSLYSLGPIVLILFSWLAINAKLDFETNYKIPFPSLNKYLFAFVILAIISKIIFLFFPLKELLYFLIKVSEIQYQDTMYSYNLRNVSGESKFISSVISNYLIYNFSIIFVSIFSAVFSLNLKNNQRYLLEKSYQKEQFVESNCYPILFMYVIFSILTLLAFYSDSLDDSRLVISNMGALPAAVTLPILLVCQTHFWGIIKRINQGY